MDAYMQIVSSIALHELQLLTSKDASFLPSLRPTCMGMGMANREGFAARAIASWLAVVLDPPAACKQHSITDAPWQCTTVFRSEL